MSLLTVKRKFIYPTSTRFPMDGLITQIVFELEKRGWKVPGIRVKFHEWGSGEEKFRRVEYITGEDFIISLDRKGIHEMTIPRHQLIVYDDNSGPTYYVYVGNEWEKDKEGFMRGTKVHSRLDKKPKTYLKYSGRSTYRGAFASRLIADDDLDREYSPEGREAIEYPTTQVFDKFRGWIKKYILDVILKTPETGINENFFEDVEVIPFEPYRNLFPALFIKHTSRELARIRRGKIDYSKLSAEERYGFSGSGRRLLGLGVKNDGTINQAAYEGFEWVGVGEIDQYTHSQKVEVQRGDYDKNYICKLALKYANNVWVVDQYAYDDAVKSKELEMLVINDNRDTFTDEEVNEFQRIRARTLIPVTEYKGDYKNPFVLINREIGFDEIEWITGPWKDNMIVCK